MCVCVCEGQRGGGAERAGVRARERERDLLSHLSPCTLYCPFSICSSTAAVTLHLRGQRVCAGAVVVGVVVMVVVG